MTSKMRLFTAALIGLMFSQTVLPANPLPSNRTGLTKVRVGQDIEVTTVEGEAVLGRVVTFDGCRIQLDSRQSEIDCAQIKIVKIIKAKRTKSPALASHLTGGTKAVVMVAIAVGLVLVIGIVSAKNTR